MFNLPLSTDIGLEFNPGDKQATFRFKSWSGPRQLSLRAEEVLELLDLLCNNQETIRRQIEEQTHD